MTDVPSSSLWRVLADIPNWSVWDEDIEFTQIAGLPQLGSKFVLKPKGAPSVKLTIEEFVPPHRFIDVTQFPFAQMRTVHEFIDTAAGTEIQVTVQVRGILGFLWQRMIAQKQVDGLPEQILRFIQLAREFAA
ncbi:MAG: polyketide cyclase [Pseudanabaena sp.]|nr:MAG: polyketide cyclase [Pseudanabaena sp.]